MSVNTPILVTGAFTHIISRCWTGTHRWGTHDADLFASSLNAHCERFFSQYWCPGTSGVNAFLFDWSKYNCWINPPFRLIGDVLRHLEACGAAATIIVPYWPTSTWWYLLAGDTIHLADFVVDWLWLPRHDRALFIPGQNSGNQRPHAPPA